MFSAQTVRTNGRMRYIDLFSFAAPVKDRQGTKRKRMSKVIDFTNNLCYRCNVVSPACCR